MPVAIVTGASKGLGRALGESLAKDGWSLVVDARGLAQLEEAAAAMSGAVTVRVGDVADRAHRAALLEAAAELGGLDLLVNNASTLGPSPLLSVKDYPVDELRRVYEVNVLAPVALMQLALPLLNEASTPTIVNITSDASVEHYENWGGYGSAKAALDHISLTFAAETGLRVLVVDPGDMRTEMQQAAFPGEDISDRPEPGEAAARLRVLIASDASSGRYRADDFGDES